MNIDKLYFVKCWINSPSTLQPFHDYHGKEVVAVYESISDELNNKEPLFSFSFDSSTAWQIPSLYLAKGNKKKREAGVRYISVQMAIMSHLSDAQDISSAYEYSTLAHDHINFAKQLVLTYPDTSIEVSENELNELWKKTIQ